MLTILYILTMATTQPAIADACEAALADGPNLEGIAIDYAQACQQDQAAQRLAVRQVQAPTPERPLVESERPDWAFAPMRHQPELDAELALIGPRANPFATDDDGLGPFAR